MKKLGLVLAVLFIGMTFSLSAQNVYVSAKGKKYHKEGCQYLDKKPTSMTKEDAEKKGYTPCSVCFPAVETVYVAPNGDKYHKKGCKYIDKTATSMSKDDAVKKGLTPCSVCYPPEKGKSNDKKDNTKKTDNKNGKKKDDSKTKTTN
jgi:hypothetical protein